MKLVVLVEFMVGAGGCRAGGFLGLSVGQGTAETRRGEWSAASSAEFSEPR